MARPKKQGLDYFPMDVVFDEKVQAIELLHKNDGLVWIVKFWQKAYKSYSGEVDLSGTFGVIQAENCRITTGKQAEIITDCITVGLLIEVRHHVYTSNGIQKRLNTVIKSRESDLKRKTQEFSNSFPVENPRKTGETKQNKTKQNKRQEIKPISPDGDSQIPKPKIWKTMNSMDITFAFRQKIANKVGGHEQAARIFYRLEKHCERDHSINPIRYLEAGLKDGFMHKACKDEFDSPSTVKDWVQTEYYQSGPQSLADILGRAANGNLG